MKSLKFRIQALLIVFCMLVGLIPFDVKAEVPSVPVNTDYLSAVSNCNFDSYYQYLKYKINYKHDITSNTTVDGLKTKLTDSTFKQDLSHLLFISRYGVDTLNSISQSDEEKQFLTWLFENPDIMNKFLEGGEPRGNNKVKALSIWEEIWRTDLESHSGIYLTLAMATALDHASPIETWYQVDENGKGTVINPISRYNNYKVAHKSGKLYPIFDTLDVWHMRMVVGSWATDADLDWLRTTYSGPHSIVSEKGVNRNFDKKYDRSNIASAGHELEYNTYNAAGISVQKGTLDYYGPNATLETVLKVGGVCGAIAKYGASAAQAYGVPAIPIGQPGHAAAIYNNGDGVWSLHNDISGFGESFLHGGTIIPWSASKEARYVESNGSETTRNFAPAYMLLFEDASKNPGELSLSERLRLLANEINQPNIAKSIRNIAMEICPKNIQIWRDYISALKADSTTKSSEWSTLNNNIITVFANHPRPMTELLQSIESEVLSESNEEIKLSYINSVFKAYEAITDGNQIGIRDIIERSMSNWMFDYIPKPEITFSFNGDNADKLMGFRKGMSFSIDGGKTFSAPSSSDYKLSINELNALTEENKILVKNKYSTDTSKDKMAIIEITANTNGDINVKGDDKNNTINGIDDSMEFSVNKGLTWTMYNGSNLPDLTGDVTLFVRKPGNGLMMPSKAIENIYTSELNLALNKTAIASSTYNDGTTNGAVDGKSNSSWLCAGAGSQWIYVDLGKIFNINGVKLNWGDNPSYWEGYAKKYKIQVSTKDNITEDANDWTDVYFTDDGNGGVDRISFSQVPARYVRMMASEVSGGWWYCIHDFEVYDGSTSPIEFAKPGVTYLSDMIWTSGSNGWGTAGSDMSVNGATNKTGQRIMLDGKQYIKGLGLHANSNIQYNLDGKYKTFCADIGIDDEVGSVSKGATVTYEVIKDATTIYKSDTLTKDSPIEHLKLDVTGAKTLTLKISNADDGNSSDHADWANAYLLTDAIEETVDVKPESTSGGAGGSSSVNPLVTSSGSSSTGSSGSIVDNKENEIAKLTKNFITNGETEVEFNSDIDEKSLTRDSIYIEDYNGEKLETTLKYNAVTKSVNITPVTPYRNGEVYKVYITKKLMLANGESIPKELSYKFVSAYKELKLHETTEVSPNKEWIVKLNKPLDSKKFVSGCVKVYDDEGNLIDITASIVDKQNIKVTPKEAYKKGKAYYLFVDDLVSEQGKVLKEGKWIKFTIKNS